MKTYQSQKSIAEQFDLSISTVKRRVDEMRDQQGKRYKAGVVIDDGQIVLVNRIAFIDWLNVRGKVKRKIPVEPFDAVGLAEGLGLVERVVINNNTDGVKQVLQEMAQLITKLGGVYA